MFGMEENEPIERAILKVNINKATVLMQVDTGAAVTIIPKGICKLELRKSSERLKLVTGQAVKLAQQTTVKVQLGRAFFGNGWIRRLTSNVIGSVDNAEKPFQLREILNKYSDTVFKPGLVELKEIKVQLHLNPEAQPTFYKPRAVPFTVKPKLEKALEEIVEEGNLKRVDYSRWGTPVVPVVKPNGTVQVCGDYSYIKHVFRSATVPITESGGMFSRYE
uniref:Peptidase A2 domain-containing protein n=1 Tax=Amphimedon queenslandica TaxID=400682 RepID=A0A1X7UWI9_AMPQE